MARKKTEYFKLKNIDKANRWVTNLGGRNFYKVYNLIELSEGNSSSYIYLDPNKHTKNQIDSIIDVLIHLRDDNRIT